MLERREAFLPMSLAQLARRFPSGEETTYASQAADLIGGTYQSAAHLAWACVTGSSRMKVSVTGTTFVRCRTPCCRWCMRPIDQPTWVPVHGEDLFKLRILLSGRLLGYRR